MAKKKCTRIGFIVVLLFGPMAIILLLQLKNTEPSTKIYKMSMDDENVVYDGLLKECLINAIEIHPKGLYRDYFETFRDPSWIKKKTLYSISYKDLYASLFGSDVPNLYKVWPNYFNKTFDGTYPHTSLSDTLFASILEEVHIPVHLVVEVGSFMGKSSTNIASTLRKHESWSQAVLLCIDTWLGGNEHWTQSEMRKLMGYAYGRPIVFEQFIANVIANNLTNTIIPFSTTSILGARFLLQHKIMPQMIYLDSAHLEGETFIELELYWALLQPGGILLGDDWSWRSVRCDVMRFCKNNRANVVVKWNTWYIKKTEDL